MSSTLATASGAVVAATGLAHFVKPELFEGITGPLFPDNLRTWVYRNGTTETVLGLALMSDKTRKAGLIGLGIYTAWLTSRAVAAQN